MIEPITDDEIITVAAFASFSGIRVVGDFYALHTRLPGNCPMCDWIFSLNNAQNKFYREAICYFLKEFNT